MFEKFMQGLSDVFGDLGSTAKKFVGSKSMNRLAAVAAMVSYLPDKDADVEEIKRAVKAMYAITGGVYTIEEMQAAIDTHLKALMFDDDIGKAQLMAEIAPARGTEEAALLVACGIAVGKASGPDPKSDPFTPDERKLVAEISVHLGEDPKKQGIL